MGVSVVIKLVGLSKAREFKYITDVWRHWGMFGILGIKVEIQKKGSRFFFKDAW